MVGKKRELKPGTPADKTAKSMPEVKPAKKKQTVKKNRVHDTEKADNKASKVSIETIRRLASHGLTIEQIGCFSVLMKNRMYSLSYVKSTLNTWTPSMKVKH
jgi:hypothetical protein